MGQIKKEVTNNKILILNALDYRNFNSNCSDNGTLNIYWSQKRSYLDSALYSKREIAFNYQGKK